MLMALVGCPVPDAAVISRERRSISIVWACTAASNDMVMASKNDETAFSGPLSPASTRGKRGSGARRSRVCCIYPKGSVGRVEGGMGFVGLGVLKLIENWMELGMNWG